ncbi:exodeoxyribonuclease VII large subunit [uncultured Mailhella sp.]|uniref:exodeoxyribonuclease VII large subunit n=1 Tax=uncultured Mailhella sp. TaxID=1981031 RepID=UPI00262F9B17|nr:exodeoxyribonuclease VII large subunit [uncultured Mailhella sp.]
MDAILSVRELTEHVRRAIEGRLPYVWVQGEVTNLSRPASGHVYFSLKEDDCLLNCVWFRRQQKQENFDPLTGEVWDDGPRPSLALSMENGQTLICSGRLTVYGARGQYQLVVDTAQSAGQGLWYQEFEALKRRLAAEGLFDAAHKRPLPREPRRVAVVTAPSGAAIRDFIRISEERGLSAEIRLYPTPVQGDDAPPAIAEALRQAGRDAWAQVIVLIRGGGSVQDLWAFNDEAVARAVYASPIPVLTGIGHEIDHSIADFAADASAATPSHTAQMLWQERTVFAQRVDGMELALTQSMERRLRLLSQFLAHQRQALGLLSPQERLRLHRERLNALVRRMDTALAGALEQKVRLVERFSAALSSLPGGLERREARLEALALRLNGAGEARLARAAGDIERAALPLPVLGRSLGTVQEHALSRLELRLHSGDPDLPLRRGYAMVRDSSGGFLRSVSGIAAGMRIAVALSDGRLLATVDAVIPSPEEGERP